MSRARRKRVLKAAGWAGAAVLLGLAVTAAFVLFTTTGTAFVLRSGVDWIDTAIAGRVRVQSIEGTLGSTVVLHRAAVSDRAGGTIVAARRIEADVDLGALVLGEVGLTRLELEGADVVVNGEWSDISPPERGDPAAAPDDDAEAGVGPDLPAVRVAALRIAGGTLWMRSDGGREPLVTDLDVSAHGRGDGRQASLSLSGSATLPGYGVVVNGLAAEVAWSDPVATVSSIEIETNAGRAAFTDAHLDAATLAWGLRQLQVEPDTAWLAHHVPEVPALTHLRLDGSASGGTSVLLARATSPEFGDVTAQLDVDATGLPLSVRGSVRCDDCGAPGFQAEATVDATADLRDGRVHGAIAARAGGTALTVEATLHPLDELEAHAMWAADDLSELAALAARFGAPSGLAGSTGGSAECHATLQPLAVRCATDARVDGLAPGSNAALAADVAVDAERVAVQLRALRLAVPQAEFVLDHEAEARVADGRLEFDDITLRDTAGRGLLHAEGTLDPAAQSDLLIELRGVDLSAARAVVPGLRAAGRLDARVRATGTRDALVLAANVHARGLAYDGVDIGIVDLDATAAGSAARGVVSVRGGSLGRVVARGRVPSRFDARQLDVAWGPGPVRGEVELADFDAGSLAVLDPAWIGGGTLRGRAHLSGTLRRPRVDAQLEGTDLAWASTPLGRGSIAGEIQDARARVELLLKPPQADTLVVRAHAPVRLDLEHGRVGWSSADDHEVVLSAANIDLASLRPRLAGRADVGGTLRGPLGEASFRGWAAVQHAAWDGKPLGAASGTFRSSPDGTWLRGFAEGALAERVEFSAHIPATLDVPTPRAVWARGAPHALDATARGVDLERVSALLPSAAATGTLALTASLRGTATDPRLTTSVHARRITVQGVGLDVLDADASYRSGAAHLDAVGERGGTEGRVRAMVPARLDLGAMTARWDPSRRHEVVARVDGLTRESLRPLSIPAQLDPRGWAELEISGTERDFDARATAFASVKAPGDGPRHRFSLRADASQSAQHVRVRVHEGKLARGHVAAQAAFDVPALLAGEDVGGTDVDAQVDLRDIGVARLLEAAGIDVHQATGTLNTRLDLDGTLAAPRLRGALVVKGVSGTVLDLGQRVEGLTSRVEFSNDRIALTRFSLRSGRGRLTATGHVDLEPGAIVGELVTRADALPVRPPGLPALQVTSTATTAMKASRDGASVDIGLANTRVSVLSLSTSGAKGVPAHPRVSYVDRAPTPRPGDAWRWPTASLPPVHATLELEDSATVVGPMINTTWDGGVRLDTGAAVHVAGAIQAQPRSSTFELLGHTFTLSEGALSITDDGDLTPFVSVRASTVVDTVTIYADIHGRVTQPELRLSSNPPLPEQEVFAILVTGTADVAGQDSDDVAAKAATALAAFTSPALQRAVGQRLGVDSVRLSFGESLNDPIVSIGKQVRKKLYTEARFRANRPEGKNSTEVMLRYKFLPQWSYEVFVGDADTSGMGLWWIRVFDVSITEDQ